MSSGFAAYVLLWAVALIFPPKHLFFIATTCCFFSLKLAFHGHFMINLLCYLVWQFSFFSTAKLRLYLEAEFSLSLYRNCNYVLKTM